MGSGSLGLGVLSVRACLVSFPVPLGPLSSRRPHERLAGVAREDDLAWERVWTKRSLSLFPRAPVHTVPSFELWLS